MTVTLCRRYANATKRASRCWPLYRRRARRRLRAVRTCRAKSTNHDLERCTTKRCMHMYMPCTPARCTKSARGHHVAATMQMPRGQRGRCFFAAAAGKALFAATWHMLRQGRCCQRRAKAGRCCFLYAAAAAAASRQGVAGRSGSSVRRLRLITRKKPVDLKKAR